MHPDVYRFGSTLARRPRVAYCVRSDRYKVRQRTSDPHPPPPPNLFLLILFVQLFTQSSLRYEQEGTVHTAPASRRCGGAAVATARAQTLPRTLPARRRLPTLAVFTSS